MSFEVQELPDLIKIITLVRLGDGKSLEKDMLNRRIEKTCRGYVCIDIKDVNKALEELTSEGLIVNHGGRLKPTEKGLRISKEWQNLLLAREPIMETVAGLTDGSITGLVVILSTILAGLTPTVAAFAAILSLTSVAITNFSSFLLGGKTEDIADLLTLENLIHYSLSDIPDKTERDRSLKLAESLFIILKRERGRTNYLSALTSGTTTFLAGIIPIIAFLTIPTPLGTITSLSIVAAVVLIFLVRYRSRKTKIHWKTTLVETTVIIAVAVLASLLIGKTF
ncbi:MAG: VIT1/CCC1 transporter family protein [Nitrososphaeria archaeon]